MLIRMRAHFLSLLCGVMACAGTSPSPRGNAVDEICAAAPVLDLPRAGDSIQDPSVSSGCVMLAADATIEREYLVIAHGTAGFVLPSALRADAVLEGGEARSATTASVERNAGLRATTMAEDWHAHLRERERIAAERWRRQADRLRLIAPIAAAPVVGATRSFIACADLTCDSLLTIGAVARSVGRRIAIYVDTLAPANGYTPADLDAVTALFDDHLYPIDTTAFGAPSDVDGNGVVIALLTQAVNRLGGAGCRNGRILGYFDGTDLLPGQPGSNGGEIFFAEVPDPAGPCPVPLASARDELPVTFVHELQHMISFRQHVLERGGPTESTWLNEGLSHLAEELAGRSVPEEPGATRTRLTQFALKNLDNAYGFLLAPDRASLVFGSSSSGSPDERGAVWLFTRWLADHFAPPGEPMRLTRALLETSRTGADNIAAATGQPFGRLAGRWLAAGWLDDLAGVQAAEDLAVPSWNLRETFARLHAQDPGRFPRPFPLLPALGGTEPLQRAVTLRSGSGAVARVVIPSGTRPYPVRLTDPSGAVLSAPVAARLLVVRVR